MYVSQTNGKALPSWLTFSLSNGAVGFSGTPPQDWNGNLDIRLIASDGKLTVGDDFRLTVTPVDDDPVALAKTMTITEDSSLDVRKTTLLSGATDPDGVAPTLQSVGNATHGVITSFVVRDNTFTPDKDFNGIAGFDYTVIDSTGRTSTAHVTVNVTAVNDAPTVTSPIANQGISEDASWTFKVPDSTFADVDNATLTLSAWSVINGVQSRLPSWLSFDAATGTFAGAPPANWNGEVALRVNASDGALVANSDFTLNVASVEDAPIAVNDRIVISKNGNISIPYATLMENDYDPDGDTLVFGDLSGNVNGASVKFINDTVFFSPNYNFVGQAGFDYTVSDGHGGVAKAHVTVDVSDALHAADDRLFMDEDTQLTIPLSRLIANDVAPSGTIISVTGFSNVTGGTLPFVDFAGTRVFRPSADFNGLAGFDYTISDGQGHTDVGHVTIRVDAVNDAPVANPDYIAMNSTDHVFLPTYLLIEDDTDVDGDALTFLDWNSSGDKISVSQISPDMLLIGANTDKYGLSTFTYRVGDGHGGIATGQVTVDVNAPPVAGVDLITIFEDQESYESASYFLFNDRDPEGGKLTIVSVGNASHMRSVELVGSGHQQWIDYLSEENYSGSGGFDYVVQDERGSQSTGHVFVNVVPTVDRYVAVDDYIGGSLEDAGIDYEDLISRLTPNDLNVDGWSAELKIEDDGSFTIWNKSNITYRLIPYETEYLTGTRAYYGLTDPKQIGSFDFDLIVHYPAGDKPVRSTVYIRPYAIDIDPNDGGGAGPEAVSSYAWHDVTEYNGHDLAAMIMPPQDMLLL